MKLFTQFNHNILAKKKNFIKLLIIIQREDESTRIYLKRFNEKMLYIKNLIKPNITEAFINEVHDLIFI